MGHQLSAVGRQQMFNLLAKMAQAYGAQQGAMEFAATPSVAQTLNELIVVDGNPMLELINIIGVPELKGEKVLMGLTGSVSSRTDTSGAGERSPNHLLNLGTKDYELFKTDSDTALKYALIDAWAKFKDFAERYNKLIRKAIGNDRIKTGWYGTSVAADTDIVTYPNLEDLNIGWLELLRLYNGGSQVVTAVPVTAEIILGGVDFPNLDSLVHDARGRLAEPFREDPDLVCMVGSTLMQAEKGAYYVEQGRTPTEKDKLREKAIVDTYGGLPSYSPPFFPADSILVTSWDNLSIYHQEDSWRREVVNNPKKDQYENYTSRNEGYVVEQEGKASLVEGITLPA